MAVARVTAFNNLLQDIVNIVSRRFPEDKDLEYTRSKIELYVSLSPRQTISTFMKSAQPYLEEILNKNDAFFIGMAQQSDVFSTLQLDSKWSLLEDTDRETLWKNVQKMLVLGNKILSE